MMRRIAVFALLSHSLGALIGWSGEVALANKEAPAAGDAEQIDCPGCGVCEPWADWTVCEDGWRSRRSLTCDGVREQSECDDSEGLCGPWTRWIPSDVDCTVAEMQERHRHGCPTVEEVKVCVGFTCGMCHAKADCAIEDQACACRTGYQGDGYYCQDIDECQSGEPCGPNATCSNTGGSFTCTCVDGYQPKDTNSAASKENECEDINECLLPNPGCDENASCVNDTPGYRCVCNTGWGGDGTTCTDVDLCAGWTECPDHSTCEENEAGNDRVCPCDSGWVAKDGECADIDECTEDTHKCTATIGTCTNSQGSYTCTCAEGYELVGLHDCEDIHECDEGIANCNTDVGACTNTIGSFTCSCGEGYTLADDGYTCENIDECGSDGAICGPHTTCADTIGKYSCTPDEGYRPTDPDKFCNKDNPAIDINECTSGTYVHNCSGHATCDNIPGSFTCTCNTGYTGNGHSCNKEACHEVHNPCDALAECSVDAESPEDVTCICQTGYTGSGLDGFCDDFDECAADKDNVCGDEVGSTCHNLIGSYDCLCHTGYRKELLECHDIDQCETGDNDCGPNTVCSNLPGLFECHAKPGYRLDPGGKTATDIDECVERTDNCGTNTICVNLPGHFRCDCMAGYMKQVFENVEVPTADIMPVDEAWLPVEPSPTVPDPEAGLPVLPTPTVPTLPTHQNCVDKDECALGLHKCHKNASCTNTDGSYTCKCHCAFSGDGFTCTDIDWCATDDCHSKATCAETSTGCGYTCTCEDGYSGCGHGENGCGDVNECASSPCDDNAECTNTIGDFTCRCKDGYRGSGLTCVDIDECAEETDNCDSVNGTCTNILGSFTCACKNGWLWESDLDPEGRWICADRNECLGIYPEGCRSDQGYTCTNNDGSFVCGCQVGWYADGDLCLDKDECENDTHACSTHANCENSRGSYTCRCKAGYTVESPNSLKHGTVFNPCVDVDECEKGTHACSGNARCDDTEGSYTCTCNDGWSGDGLECVNLDLCDAEHNPCHTLATCEESLDESTQICRCPTGYEGEGFGTDGCKNKNECEDPDVSKCDLPENGGTCTDSLGSWTCGCQDGYTMVDNNKCSNINECADRSVSGCAPPPGGKCVDQIGSWLCGCRSGWRLEDDNSCTEIDECDPATHECHDNAVCENTIGSYTCTCLPGYALLHPGDPNPGHRSNGCFNWNECEHDYSNNCSEHAECEDTIGSYTCTCNEGYLGDGVVCADVNWCLGVDCGANKHCLENESNTGYTCNCDAGYSLVDGVCTDIDECVDTVHPHNCPSIPGMKCENSIGSFSCVCKDGWRMEGTICVDINECTDGNDSCDNDNGYCENLVPGHQCHCNSGFRLDSATGYCNDIKECTEEDADRPGEPLHQCSDHATCVEGAGSYYCVCDDGYHSLTARVNDPCINVNECKDGISDCAPAPLGKCSDTEGSWECECDTGYSGDGKLCVKTDWCATAECNTNAECRPLSDNSGYLCKCNTGWEGNGDVGEDGCTDINECGVPAMTPCYDSMGGTCTNIDGSYECGCAAGYEMKDGTCSEIDECTEGTDTCDRTNGACSNSTGSYDCSCNTGYAIQADNSCLDINECLEATRHDCLGDRTAYCQNTAGSYECHCIDGYVGDGKTTCLDKNECETGEHQCLEHSYCWNEPGTWRCKCDPGYVSRPEAYTRGTVDNPCKNLNECKHREVICDSVNGICHDDEPGYHCTCKPGYLLAADGGTCINLDLCDDDPCSPHAECEESADESEAICTCKSGYSVNPVGAGDGKGPEGCVDDNECTLGTHNCFRGDGGVCSNTGGSFTCACEGGFSGDGYGCSPINECDDPDQNNCAPEGSVCTDTRNSYTCQCDTGYTGNGTSCTDENECSNPVEACGENSTCTNEPGSYYCTCNDGFAPPNTELPCGPNNPAEAIDECANNTHTCSTNALCRDLTPSMVDPRKFSCTCLTGYEGDGYTCSLKDACESNGHLCHSLAECVDAGDGITFSCLCRAGYTGNGTSKCDNEDECVDESGGPTSVCGANGVCTDTIGSYTCGCTTGYRRVADECIDIDECTEGCHGCRTHSGVCTNIPGSYECACKTGFENNEAKNRCQDIDECAVPGTCSEYGICLNSPGAHICTCPCGYTGGGTPDDPCVDIDEVWDGGHNCSPHATVTNTIGSWTCACKDGYSGDGVTCTDVDLCAEDPLPPNTTCTEISNGTDVSYACATGYLLPDGANIVTDGCVDHNECDDDTYTTLCAETGSVCSNTTGGYTCACDEGYSGDGYTCDDDDECASGQDNCAHCSVGGLCSNTPGGFTCSCSNGYRLAADGHTCIDIDECLENVDDCDDNSTCWNTNGTFGCTCNAGWGYGTGKPEKPCRDIDECTEGTAGCSPVATCTNTLGSFTCTCTPQYEGDGITCDDADLCASAGCSPKADCEEIRQNTAAQCTCIDGYVGDGIGVTGCVNVDECSDKDLNACPSTADCHDNQGSYTCECKTGYTGDGETCTDVNECLEEDACQGDHKVCVNTVGSYECQCKEHYEAKGFECQLTDYCEDPLERCGVNAVCLPFENGEGYACACEIGFKKDEGLNQGCRVENDTVACRTWGPWSICHVGDDEQAVEQTPAQYRYCNDQPTYYEQRECPHRASDPPGDTCGAWGPWSEPVKWMSPEAAEYKYSYRIRQYQPTKTECTLYEERRDTTRYEAQAACEPLGDSSECGDPSKGLQYRVFTQCTNYHEFSYCEMPEGSMPTPGTPDESVSPANPASCAAWDPWGQCDGGMQSRGCVAPGYADREEIRVCDSTAVPVCGAYGPWSSCDGNGLSTRTRAGCTIKESRECNSVGTNAPLLAECGSWLGWSPCAKQNGSPMSIRQLGYCNHYEAMQCDIALTIPGDDVATTECDSWAHWTSCDGGKTHQTRNCLMGSAQEKRECPGAMDPNCGAMSDFTACDNGIQTRNRTGCLNHNEVFTCSSVVTLQKCGTKVQPWGNCHDPLPWAQIRAIGSCTDEFETQSCSRDVGSSFLQGTTRLPGEEAVLEPIVDDGPGLSLPKVAEEVVTTTTTTAAPSFTEALIAASATSCNSWGLYSPCDVTGESTRTCHGKPGLTEVSSCSGNGDCGAWGTWQPLGDYMVSRARTNCPQPHEQLEALNKDLDSTCGSWGPWGDCGLEEEFMQFRRRSQCLVGCNCVESQSCGNPPEGCMPGDTAPSAPWDGGATPGDGTVPVDGGETPVTPGEGGETPVTPGDGGETPSTPGDGGETPSTPGDGGETPTIPDDETTTTSTVAPSTGAPDTGAPETETPPEDEGSGKSESAGGSTAAIAGGVIGAVIIVGGMGAMTYYNQKSKGEDEVDMDVEEEGLDMGGGELSDQEEVIEFEEDAWAEDV